MEGGKTWVRVETIGRGSSSTVSLAKSRRTRRKRTSRSNDFPSIMAVKSAEISESGSLQKEREILRELEECPHIVHCYGEEFTDEKNGDMVYNLLLEYASGGTLAKLIKNSTDGSLPESEIRRYTRSILRGLRFIKVMVIELKWNRAQIVHRKGEKDKRKRFWSFKVIVIKSKML